MLKDILDEQSVTVPSLRAASFPCFLVKDKSFPHEQLCLVIDNRDLNSRVQRAESPSNPRDVELMTVVDLPNLWR